MCVNVADRVHARLHRKVRAVGRGRDLNGLERRKWRTPVRPPAAAFGGRRRERVVRPASCDGSCAFARAEGAPEARLQVNLGGVAESMRWATFGRARRLAVGDCAGELGYVCLEGGRWEDEDKRAAMNLHGARVPHGRAMPIDEVPPVDLSSTGFGTYSPTHDVPFRFRLRAH